MSLRPLTLLGIVTSMVTGIALGITGYHAWQSSDLDSADIHALQQAVAEIQLNYVDDIPKQQLVNDALRGMLDGLDDHSNFLDASAFDDLQAETRGHFGGIGIVCDHQQRDVELFLEPLEQTENLVGCVGVKVASWFVGHHNFRIGNNRPPNANSLFLPTR